MSSVYPIFRSFIQAGFECSTHKIKTGRRLDLLASTQHDRFAREDYKRLQTLGIRTIRVAARWHLIERVPHSYDFASLAVLLDAAAETETEVLLDLLHFGWPDHLDVFASNFPSEFARYTYALTRFLRTRGGCCTMFAPVNEISFLAWAAGEEGTIYPCAVCRGSELKRNLARAAIAASEILLNELPAARLIFPEPVINVVANPAIAGDEIDAENYCRAQFEAWDIISGRLAPELGGDSRYLDIIGVNFYKHNQWIHKSEIVLTRDDVRYRPFHELIEEVWTRYRRPIFVSETGTEGERRVEWFNYVCDEVRRALNVGIPVHGICLYPIVNHPGWVDDRHCCNGLFDYADQTGNRDLYWPLARAILNQQAKLPACTYQLAMDINNNIDLICLSHLRWGFVFQRPQHLMSRFALTRRVFFFEEPVFENGEAHLRSSMCHQSGVHVYTPVLPKGLSHQQTVEIQRTLLTTMLEQNNVKDYIAWYYTPMAREFASGLKPRITIYDCMDELSAFAGAPPAIRDNEQALFRDADLVFTGGASLFESKRTHHPAVHLFPSSVEVAHFARARSITDEPADQGSIPHPRLGYAGVIDERMDLQLLEQVALEKPDWHLIMLGPVVKIDEGLLPKLNNIHYLGMKDYSELPAYFSSWDVALLPFALNESTRFISPTKTPEYLAAGLPVVSTPIADVIRSYGSSGLVSIADGTRQFVSSVDALLQSPPGPEFWVRVDQFLSRLSWDQTWSRMNRLIEEKLTLKSAVEGTSTPIGVITGSNQEGTAHV